MEHNLSTYIQQMQYRRDSGQELQNRDGLLEAWKRQLMLVQAIVAFLESTPANTQTNTTK